MRNRVKFSEINIDEIQKKGYDKLLVMKEGQMIVGGSIKNILMYKDILKEKRVINQFGTDGVWVIDIID